jgi:hypothetical protein
MTLWDWMFVFYCSAALTVAALLFIRWARPKPQTYLKEWICDGCGQVSSELQEGMCAYCTNFYKPTEHCRQRGK